MVDVNKIKGLIAEHGKTYEDVAKCLGITPKTFGVRMKTGVFNSNEMDAMIDFLEIENPAEIFFTQCVTHGATK